ncbi:MAG TPA: hypothetical protein VHG91_10550 [Longimicrobium sp.]|nr:hypothetical protein [Longimicrobium sp.]
MRAKTTILTAALLFCAPVAARAATPEPPVSEEAGEAERASRGVTVSVDNQSWQAVRIYAVINGGRRALGRVESRERRDFRLPEAASSGRVHLLATWTPQEGITTEPVSLTPGTRLEWRILDAPGGNPGATQSQLLFH